MKSNNYTTSKNICIAMSINKRHFFLLMILIAFTYACKNENNHRQPAINIEEDKNEIKDEVVEKDEIQIEDKIFSCIENIEKSSPSNRKKSLDEFVGYEDEINDGIAEAYYGFAYDYPTKNPIEYFSVLEKEDSTLVKKWAESAVWEYMLVLGNINSPDKFRDSIKKDYTNKIKNLDSNHRTLAELYYNQLEKKHEEILNGAPSIKEEIIHNNPFLADFLSEYNLLNNNLIDDYIKYDFSNLWFNDKTNSPLGTIGDDNQRIKIRFTEIRKNPENPYEYTVKGKSKVKNNICDFTGSIKLEKIYEAGQINYGFDRDYKYKGITKLGILIANYEFYENKEQEFSGKFEGKLYSKWVLNYKNQIAYDDIESNSDIFTNNVFLGKWINYKTNKSKNCSWADNRVPNGTKDLDIGAGKFSPNEKYFDKGWSDYFSNKDQNWWK